LLLVDTVFKDFHCIKEAAIFHRNDQINRIEVYPAIKASCQVGFMIGGRMKVIAQGALEPEYFVIVAHLKIQ
jgi:hypothetical protein